MTIGHEKEEDVKSHDRKHDRFDVALNVYDKDGNLIGVTTNISREGIFIETDKDINWDEIYMTLSIELPENKGMLKSDGLVVMGRQGGYGVTLFPDDESKKQYAELIDSLRKVRK